MGTVLGPCPVLVERDPELRALSGTASECAVRGARLVLLTGEAGVGKTRLWREFVDTLPEGWQVEYVGGHQSDRSWSAPFEALVGTLDDTADPARELGAGVADACRGRSAEAPLVLVVEDLHFLDPVGVAALPYALDRLHASSVLVIATYRLGSHPVGSEHSRSVAELLRHAGAFELRLGPLSEAGVREMVAALGADADAAAVHERAHGNPFFIEELVRSGVEEIPWTVSEAVLHRMEALTDPAVHLAELLAVAGGPLPSAVLAHIDADWSSALRVLSDAALALGAGDEAVLRHALVADALAERLDAADRRRCHAEIAGAVEAVAPDRVELLARHWAGAGEVERAAQPAAVAADGIGARGGHRTATELYRIALEHPPEDPAEAAYLLERAATSAALASDDELARSWAAAARLAGESSGPRWQATGTWGNPVFQRIVQQEAEVGAERAEALSAQIVDAQDLVRRGEYASAVQAARRVLSEASAAGDLGLEADAALILFYAGDLGGAAIELERIAEQARRDGQPIAATNALARHARLLVASGDLAAATAVGGSAIAVSRSTGDEVVWGSMQMGAGILETICGNVGHSQVLADELIASDHPMVTLMGRATAIFPALERLDPAEARAHLDAVLPAVRTLEVDYYTLPILVTDARWHQQQGDHATALDRLAQAEHLLWSPVQEHVVDFWTVRARAAAALGHRSVVEASVARLGELALYATGPAVMAAAEEATAHLAALDHLDADALARFERAAAGWEAAPRPAQAVEVWCDAAAVARRVTPGRVAELVDRALALATRHGLARVRRRAEALRGAESVGGVDPTSVLSQLTPRELEIARLVAAGRTNREVGDALYLSEKTVRNTLSPVFAKLGVTRRSELAGLLARIERP